jgi:hypothetical protein
MSMHALPFTTPFRRLAAASTALFVLGACPADTGAVRLTTTMHPQTMQGFAKLVAEYNKTHQATPIDWQNRTTGAAPASDSEAQEWVIVSAATARQWSDRQGFTAALSPRVTSSLITGFADLRQTAPDDSMLPLLGVEPVMIADYTAIDSRKGHIPGTIGDLLTLATTHRKASGRPLFAPPFGDPDHLLRFIHAQGARMAGPDGAVLFPAGELEALLQPWVDAFRRGDLPVAGLRWTEAEAARQMIGGAADMTLGGDVAVDIVAARPDKKGRRFNFYRTPSGVREDQWIEPIGLVKRRSGPVSLAAQNMTAFLMTTPVQQALADGYQAVPLAKEAMPSYPIAARGLTEARSIYLASVCMHGADGVPFLPLKPQRQTMAEAIQRALVNAVGGKPLREAVREADAWYAKQGPGTTP